LLRNRVFDAAFFLAEVFAALEVTAVIVPFAHCEALFAATREPKQLLVMSGGQI
jgi:hypothetical protein